MKSQHLARLVFSVLVASSLSAGDFVNLDFEHPDLSHAIADPVVAGDFRAPTSEALQGWILTADVLPTTELFVTPPGGLRPPVALTGGEGTIPGTGVDFGKYELYLAAPSLAPNSLQPVYRLSQTGTIPAGATQLIYYRSGPGVGGPSSNPSLFQILINGPQVPYTEAGISYADVSAFAGKEVNLEFLFLKPGNSFDIAGITIAPEPSTYALIGLAALALWWQCRRRSNS